MVLAFTLVAMNNCFYIEKYGRKQLLMGFFYGVSMSQVANYRSSRREVFRKIGVLKNFEKFTGKHLCQRPATLLKKRLWHRCFPVDCTKFLRTPFFIEHLWGLFLKLTKNK